MKKILVLMLSLLLVFCLVACSSNDTPDPSGTNNNDDPLNRDPGTSQNGGENNNGTQGGDDQGTQGGVQGGLVFEFDENWPENEYTRLLPRPSFECSSVTDDEFGLSVVSTTATVSDLRAYTEQLKAAGFNLDQEVQDTEVFGIVIYTYWANNADGYRVEVAYTSGNSLISVLPK